jgi:hypothetical protein
LSEGEDDDDDQAGFVEVEIEEEIAEELIGSPEAGSSEIPALRRDWRCMSTSRW